MSAAVMSAGGVLPINTGIPTHVHGHHHHQPAPSQQQQQPSGLHVTARPLGVGDTIEERRLHTTGKEVGVVARYTVGEFLGKGGFASVHAMTSVAVDARLQPVGFVSALPAVDIVKPGRVCAGKIIPKISLAKDSAKKKLVNEIKIHRSLNHPNVVKFERHFEDKQNVYILLELCANQTMLELIKHRKRLTEVETAYYMWQLLDTVSYLHANRVIHRDLKLGNLFLYSNMQIKVGDFGLATKLEHDEERKKTICGTPNYIAPEILESTNGHSYEVDIWSMGVIMYTLLVGKPPFEASSVKSTYNRIRTNQYEFPKHIRLSSAATGLITRILASKPESRPTLDEMKTHAFFTTTHIPKSLPTSILTLPYEHGSSSSSGSHTSRSRSGSVPVATSSNANGGAAAAVTAQQQQALRPSSALYGVNTASIPLAVASLHGSKKEHKSTAPLPSATTAGPVLDKENLIGGGKENQRASSTQQQQPAVATRRPSAALAMANAALATAPAATAAPVPAAAPTANGNTKPSSTGGAAHAQAQAQARAAAHAAQSQPILLPASKTGVAAVALAPAPVPIVAGRIHTQTRSRAASEQVNTAAPAVATTTSAALAAVPAASSVLSRALPPIAGSSSGATQPRASSSTAAAATATLSAPGGAVFTTASPPNSTTASTAPTTSASAGSKNGLEAAMKGLRMTAEPATTTAAAPAATTTTTAAPATKSASTAGSVAFAPSLGSGTGSDAAVAVPTEATFGLPLPAEDIAHLQEIRRSMRKRREKEQQLQKDSKAAGSTATTAPAAATNGAPAKRKSGASSDAPTAAEAEEESAFKRFHDKIEQSFCMPEKAAVRPARKSGGAAPAADMKDADKPAATTATAAATAAAKAIANLNPPLWVDKWVDYSSKYGLGYLLSNRHAGVCFNDSTKAVLHSDGVHFQYVASSSSSSAAGAAAPVVPARARHTVTEYPKEIHKKVTLLKHFVGYLHKPKDGAAANAPPAGSSGGSGDSASAAGSASAAAAAVDTSSPAADMIYVKKWVRTKHAILFLLTNQTIQVIFYDHTELVLWDNERYVTYTNRAREKQTVAMATGAPLSGAGASGGKTETEHKSDLSRRLKYTRDILAHLIPVAPTAAATTAGATATTAGVAPASSAGARS